MGLVGRRCACKCKPCAELVGRHRGDTCSNITAYQSGARQGRLGALPLARFCSLRCATEILFPILLLGSHVRRKISRESLFGGRGHLFAPEHLGELVNVCGAVLSLPSAGIACLHAW